ncbi:MAG: hypothetical protein IPK82_12590 [Polyangiaceae bacterium]|nr:hypothetical protein [Polyangiaceae bacterium]
MGSSARTAFSLCTLTALTLFGAFACGGGKPKQAEEPDPLKDTGQDMAAPDTAAAEGAKNDPAGEEAMHAKCCAQCKEAAEKDRSGQNPDTIPCADYSDLQPWCTEHFRVKPTMASACK